MYSKYQSGDCFGKAQWNATMSVNLTILFACLISPNKLSGRPEMLSESCHRIFIKWNFLLTD